jgi:CBS domain-containing protein
MKVSELMQTHVRTVTPDALVSEVVVSLADGHVSALPVVDGGGRMLGVVSSTDVLTAEAEATDQRARTELVDETEVQEIMTVPARTITPDADVREAARQMLYGDVHRLFVAVDDRLLGVISTTDIVRAVATGKI